MLNNHDFSNLTAEESNHLRELRHKLGNSFRFAQSNLPRALRIVRGHRGGSGRDEPSDDDGRPPPPPHMDHRHPQASLPPGVSHHPASQIPSRFMESTLNSYRNTPTQ